MSGFETRKGGQNEKSARTGRLVGQELTIIHLDRLPVPHLPSSHHPLPIHASERLLDFHPLPQPPDPILLSRSLPIPLRRRREQTDVKRPAIPGLAGDHFADDGDLGLGTVAILVLGEERWGEGELGDGSR